MKLKPNQRLSEWQPGTVKPTEVGLYQRDKFGCLDLDFINREVWYSWWNGKFWGFSIIHKKIAINEAKTKSRYQGIPWRGIIED
jgi:hypothetical protein